MALLTLNIQLNLWISNLIYYFMFQSPQMEVHIFEIDARHFKSKMAKLSILLLSLCVCTFCAKFDDTREVGHIFMFFLFFKFKEIFYMCINYIRLKLLINWWNVKKEIERKGLVLGFYIEKGQVVFTPAAQRFQNETSQDLMQLMQLLVLLLLFVVGVVVCWSF